MIIAATTALLLGCAGVEKPGEASSPTALSPTATAGAEGQRPALLARAVERLGQAKSYRFAITAVHHWRTPEGQEYDWSFEGEGAVVADRFYSVMRGPADTLYEVRMLDRVIINRDARGQRPQASTSFGGPGEGAAPYTVISYLKNSVAQGSVQTASLNGTEALRLSFSPNLSQVAAMDASHRTLQEKVKVVQGVVWIEAKTGRPSQEAVTVQSLDSRGLPQTVTITLKFSDYDAPVEIQLGDGY